MFARTREQLEAYFAKELEVFDLPLAPHGTEFQKIVWNALLDIPFGATESYGALAKRIGHEGAARAVGLANGHNPIGIVVPCHRVIALGAADADNAYRCRETHCRSTFNLRKCVEQLMQGS